MDYSIPVEIPADCEVNDYDAVNEKEQGDIGHDVLHGSQES